ncbi:MAG: ATP-binding protein [Candidatus Diapherotrites archaeon CG08_land_8_20_14_0_20_30_16]|nr:MAG: ATP-binding protein [Candidatus Diapherotrites archaeon CG08_land_8_20_14_0_20_30_16]
MILFGRDKELALLEEKYVSKTAEFCVIYGRRRIGKTYLVKKFIESKNSFYFLANQDYIETEFDRFKTRFSKEFNVFLEASDFSDLFKEIISKVANKSEKKLILIIDEFPYWIVNDKTIPSKFQQIFDEIISKQDNIMVILLGSYISIIESDVLDYKSPLYGRLNLLLNLKELPLSSLSGFFGNVSIEDKIKLFGLCDTIPFYLSLVDPQKKFEKILFDLVNPTNIFYSDAQMILSSELRSYGVYIDILKVVSEGSTTPSEIANKTKVDVSNILKYLKSLMGLRLLEKVKPVTSSEKDKNYIYVVKDNYFRFWLRYIYPYKENIELNPEYQIKFIVKDYDNYMGKVFERFCQNIFSKNYFCRGYNWWCKDKEIDIVAKNELENKIYFGECKWGENIDARSILIKLIEKSKFVDWHKNNRKEQFLIFAKSFSKTISKYENVSVKCFDLNDLDKLLKI